MLSNTHTIQIGVYICVRVYTRTSTHTEDQLQVKWSINMH